jgi:hypothetical protein
MKELNIVTNVFSGSYLEERESENIGHENINFFMPENTKGKYLLWLNHNGTFPENYRAFSGYINLLIVSNAGTGNYEYRILAYAKECEIVPGATIPGQSLDAQLTRYRRFLARFPNATYGSKTIQDIFKDNTYQNIAEEKNTLATFYTKPENVYVPKHQNIIIKIREEDDADLKQNLGQVMRMYVEDRNDEDFENLINKIEWLPFDLEKKILPGYPKDKNNYIGDSDSKAAQNKEIYKFLEKADL